MTEIELIFEEFFVKKNLIKIMFEYIWNQQSAETTQDNSSVSMISNILFIKKSYLISKRKSFYTLYDARTDMTEVAVDCVNSFLTKYDSLQEKTPENFSKVTKKVERNHGVDLKMYNVHLLCYIRKFSFA